MAKMTKLYRLNLESAKSLNIAHFNPTCKAILKAMYRIEKENRENDSFVGTTGDQILSYAVDHGLWSTRQDPSKYHTTWAYYVKKLKTDAGIVETGSSYKQSTEEFLEDEEELLEEPSDDLEEEDNEWSDDDRAVAKAEDDHQAAIEDHALMAAE
jgi:NDP-sugar pyrophosphorylase family protein